MPNTTTKEGWTSERERGRTREAQPSNRFIAGCTRVQDSSNLLFLKRWVKQGSLSPRQFCLDCDVRCRATLELPSAAGLDAYSATLAIATTPTSEQASRGHLLRPTRRPLDRPPDVRQPYFSQQTTATSAELESGSSQSRGELNQRLLSESKQTLYVPSFSTDCYVHA